MDNVDTDKREVVDMRRVEPDGGRPPLSTYDHAPTVGPSDVDKCRECGRYAPHAFDHDAECSRFEPIESESDVDNTVTSPATDTPRMGGIEADGGGPWEATDQSQEKLASCIVAAEEGDRVVIHVEKDPDTVSIYEGDVAIEGYLRADEGFGGTHIVIIDLPDSRVGVYFDRTVDRDSMELVESSAVLSDPEEDVRFPVTGFKSVER